MRCLLLFLLFVQFGAFAQQKEYYIDLELVTDNDSFPDCQTLYYANGIYNLTKQELIKIDLPNVTAVNPIDLSQNGLLNFYSFGPEATHFGGEEFDKIQIVSFTYEELVELIQSSEDSINARWLAHDDEYLWKEWGIFHDAKPEQKVIEEIETDPDPPFGPISVGSGIIDGVFIGEGGYIRLEMLEDKPLPKDFYYRSELVIEQLGTPRIDSLLRPFYLSNYELTNGEYRQFMKWVSDSIELQTAYDSLSNEDALWLLDCTKKERKLLDPTKKEENKARFGLSQSNRKKIDEEDWINSTIGTYLIQPQRYYTRKEKDPAQFIYKQSDGTEILIYPDTTGFLCDELGIYGVMMHDGSWHSAFNNYPIVNLTKDQILAYCHWKQRQLNEQFKEDGLKITVRPPYMREYEFATKVTVGENEYNQAHLQPNSHFIPFQRDYERIEFPFLQKVNFDPATFKPLKIKQPKYPTRNRIEPLQMSLDYQLWYQSNSVPNSPFKFLNGNVSEFVLDTVNADNWSYFEMNQDQPNESANYVLGTNYYTDAKTIGDDQYNVALYKSTLTQGKSSPFIGVRLVYLIEKIKTD